MATRECPSCGCGSAPTAGGWPCCASRRPARKSSCGIWTSPRAPRVVASFPPRTAETARRLRIRRPARVARPSPVLARLDPRPRDDPGSEAAPGLRRGRGGGQAGRRPVAGGAGAGDRLAPAAAGGRGPQRRAEGSRQTHLLGHRGGPHVGRPDLDLRGGSGGAAALAFSPTARGWRLVTPIRSCGSWARRTGWSAPASTRGAGWGCPTCSGRRTGNW